MLHIINMLAFKQFFTVEQGLKSIADGSKAERKVVTDAQKQARVAITEEFAGRGIRTARLPEGQGLPKFARITRGLNSTALTSDIVQEAVMAVTPADVLAQLAKLPEEQHNNAPAAFVKAALARVRVLRNKERVVVEIIDAPPRRAADDEDDPADPPSASQKVIEAAHTIMNTREAIKELNGRIKRSREPLLKRRKKVHTRVEAYMKQEGLRSQRVNIASSDGGDPTVHYVRLKPSKRKPTFGVKQLTSMLSEGIAIVWRDAGGMRATRVASDLSEARKTALAKKVVEMMQAAPVETMEKLSLDSGRVGKTEGEDDEEEREGEEGELA